MRLYRLGLWVLAAVLMHDQCSAFLQMCVEPAITLKHDNLTSEQDKNREALVSSLKMDTLKNCLAMVREQAKQMDHFYVAQINDSIALEPEICVENASELAQTFHRVYWTVALRSRNRQKLLYRPIGDVNVARAVHLHHDLKWTKVEDLSWYSDYCMTSTGVLQILRFSPKMAGTYRVWVVDPPTKPSFFKQMQDDHLKTHHHLDYVYSTDEKFDGVSLREAPVLAPKASKRRMFTTEKNLRYQHRTPDTQLKAMPINPVRPKEYRYPKEVFKQIGISMVWSPPPELHQFTDWKPSCGSKITRDRYFRCTALFDRRKIHAAFNETMAFVLGRLQSEMSIIYSLVAQTQFRGWTEYVKTVTVQHLYKLVKRISEQFTEEAKETPEKRRLYMAGFRVSTDNKHIEVPCHYTYLHHLLPVQILSEGAASIYIPSITNIGEREQAVRLCGLSDPLDLLRMMGKVLVEQLKKIVALTKRRPVVPQRSVIYNGKTVYLKCPVDLHRHKSPVCSVPGREDNVLWTLNGKTIRFFGGDIERGPSLSPTCGLTIKKIAYNDAGEYTCFRTPTGAQTIEETPAYRHFIEVIRPEYDPPPFEEVVFGLTICLAWHGFLLLLWAIVATIRGILNLLCRRPDGHIQPEVWTSFYDKEPALEHEDLDDDDVDNEDNHNEDWEDEETDEGKMASEAASGRRQSKKKAAPAGRPGKTEGRRSKANRPASAVSKSKAKND